MKSLESNGKYRSVTKDLLKEFAEVVRGCYAVLRMVGGIMDKFV